MNREIEFRAWDTENKVMLLNSMNRIFLDGTIGGSRPRILMQRTGLKDKNGTKIFEGDIVKVGGYIDGFFPDQEVKFGNGMYYITSSWGDDYCIGDFKDIEVIGNHYEHPHLLETANEK